MKFSIFATIATVASVVLAQVPGCAYSCLSQFQQDIASTGCGSFNEQNAQCFCSHQDKFDASKACARNACPGDQANQAINFLLAKCN